MGGSPVVSQLLSFNMRTGTETVEMGSLKAAQAGLSLEASSHPSGERAPRLKAGVLMHSL